MEESEIKIVLLGKTGAGKSSLSNTILGEDAFKINHTANPETGCCQKKNTSHDGKAITLIDTPGFFDPGRSEEELRSEIASCITECAPGLHAFLIVLKVEKFTEHENQIITKIKETFSEEAFKYAVLVFTHGDQLPEQMKIEEFVQENEGLNDLMKKCGNRCHVIDNKYWMDKQQDGYRNNKLQVAALLNTIKAMADSGGHYTNEMLQAVERAIQEEAEKIRRESENTPWERIIERAKTIVSRILMKIAGITTGALLGALLGVSAVIVLVLAGLANSPAGAGGAAYVGTGFDVVTRVVALGGAAVGGYVGYEEADKADSVKEVVENTAKAVINKTGKILDKMNKPLQTIVQEQSQDTVSLFKNS